MSFGKGVPTDLFYGAPTPARLQIRMNGASEKTEAAKQPKFMKKLLGPSKTWRVFKKQQEALDDCLKRRNNLMCFAFEQENGERLFLIAHPKVFWVIDSCFCQTNRHNYEVIREYSVCKLYLDLEFEFKPNESCSGDRMLRNFLKIINHNLKVHFNIFCRDDDILDLDSSTLDKFSHHIIYQIENTAFINNYELGHFIKCICSELKEAYAGIDLNGDREKLEVLTEKYQINEHEMLEFFVKDEKGKIKLFIDEGVYTKNRHFRLLGSSKAHKKVPLVVSKQNKYKPKVTEDGIHCNMFLDSLITYFSSTVTKILEFKRPEIKKIARENHGKIANLLPPTNFEGAAHSKIDEFILGLISPKGKIRRKMFFNSSFFLVYDIQNFRYCHNIGREHKSNNIKLVVDLNRLTCYQKCFDPDCGIDYKSKDFDLPEEIRFMFSDQLLSNNVTDFDRDIVRAVEEIEKKINFLDQEEIDLCEITGCIEDALNEYN